MTGPAAYVEIRNSVDTWRGSRSLAASFSFRVFRLAAPRMTGEQLTGIYRFGSVVHLTKI